MYNKISKNRIIFLIKIFQKLLFNKNIVILMVYLAYEKNQIYALYRVQNEVNMFKNPLSI